MLPNLSGLRLDGPPAEDIAGWTEEQLEARKEKRGALSRQQQKEKRERRVQLARQDEGAGSRGQQAPSSEAAVTEEEHSEEEDSEEEHALPLRLRDAPQTITDDMFGDKRIGTLLTLLAKGAVVRSGPGIFALTSLPISSCLEEPTIWIFQDFAYDLDDKGIGQGSFNTSYAVDPKLVPKSISNLYHTDVNYQTGLPRIIYRRSRKDAPEKLPTAENAIKELVITGFCAQKNLGAKLLAAYIIGEGFDATFTLRSKVSLHCFSEAWSGDLDAPLRALEVKPEEFATEFANLLERSVAEGLWHLDAKPGNMLWRRDANQRLELCWTDFDDRFCSLWNPAGTPIHEAGCSVLVHAALVVGYISCHHDNVTYKTYRPAVERELEERFKISAITDDDMCGWMQQLEGRPLIDVGIATLRRGVVKGVVKHKIANRFRSALENYLTDKRGAPFRCILKNDLGKPPIKQFYDFAVLGANYPISRPRSEQSR